VRKIDKRTKLPVAEPSAKWDPRYAKHYRQIRVKLEDGQVASSTSNGGIVVGEDLAVGRAADNAQAAEQLVREFAATRNIGSDAMRSILLKLLAQYPPPPDNAVALLPRKAPELWAKRDLNLRENAPQFIRRVYGRWLGQGLARKDLTTLDPDLYKALSVWLSRHKDDAIVEVLPPQSNQIDDLIERLSAEYSLEDLRKLGYAIDSRLRRKRV
jgi:hypothetical protein